MRDRVSQGVVSEALTQPITLPNAFYVNHLDHIRERALHPLEKERAGYEERSGNAQR